MVDLCAVNLLESKPTGNEEVYPKVTFTSKERRSVLWRVKHLVQLILLAPLAPLLYFTVTSAKEWYDRNCMRVFIGKEIHEFIVNTTFLTYRTNFLTQPSQVYKENFEARTLPENPNNHPLLSQLRNGTIKNEYLQATLARFWMDKWRKEYDEGISSNISQELIIPLA